MKSKPTYVRLLLLPLFFISTLSASAQRQNLTLEGTFEGANPFSPFSLAGNQFCCSYSLTRSTEQAKAGTGSMKIDLRKTDPVVSGSVRAEVEEIGNTAQEAERWYGGSWYLQDWGSDSFGESILQWHDTDGSAPPLAVLTYSNRIWLRRVINGVATAHDLGPVASNQWMDIVLHVKWTYSTNSGIIQCWRDGQLVVNLSNIKTNSNGGSYTKIGMNKWNWAPGGGSSSQTRRIFFIDEFRVGNANATYADVAPSSSTAPGNQPPVVNAGNDVSINLPIVLASLSGTASDPDGEITSSQWSKVSGPTSFNISTPNSLLTTVLGLVQGTYVFRLTVTDDAGATSSDDVTVNVAPLLNTSPTANAGNNITMTLPTNSTTLTGSGNDPDGTISSYLWTRVSGPTTFTLGSPNSATTTLSNLVQGTYVFRLRVTDNQGATGNDNVTVTVNPAPNQAPNANAGNSIAITLPTNSTTLNGSATDTDGSIASYAWTRVSGPTTFTIANPGNATTALTNLVQGTYVFRLTVTDDDGAIDTDNVTVTVNPAPNLAPTANAGGNISITLPTNSTTLNGTGNDTDGSIATYAWARLSGPTTFTIANASAASTALTGLVEGVYVFRLTVTDNDGATDSDDVTVTVNAPTAPANQPPSANAGTDIVITLPTAMVTLNGSGVDPDGTISTYVWTRVSGPATFTMSTPNSASTTVSNLIQAIYVFRLTVTDNNGATDTDDIRVTVNAAPPPPNVPPMANAGNNITITLPTNSITLVGSGSDADGSIATYLWTKMSGPASFVIANANNATTAVTGLVEGVYVFRLTVTDDDGGTDTDNVTVMVNAAPPPPPNVAPTADAGPDIVVHLPATSTTLNGNSSEDTDGNIVSYTWTRISGPTGFTFGNANLAATNIANLVQGTYVFRLTVTDNDGATDTDNVTVIVNSPPVANAGVDIVMTLPTNATTLNGSASSDPDGNIVSYTWTRISGPTTFTLANANGVNTGITNLGQGIYNFRLTIVDNRGASSTDQVRITVNAAPPPAPNEPPIARTGDEIVLSMPTNTTQLSGSTSSDPDGNIVGYEWLQVSGPATATMSNPNAANPTISDLVVGEYLFELTVRDNDGSTSTATLRVIVKNKNNEEIFCTLYPNPASSIIKMRYIEPEMGTFMLTVFDVNNRPIMRESMTKNTITFEKELDISKLSAGIYFLQVAGEGDKRVVRRFVKY